MEPNTIQLVSSFLGGGEWTYVEGYAVEVDFGLFFIH